MKSINPIAPHPRPIKQDELQAVLNQRLEVDTLKRSLKTAEDNLLKTELLLIDRIERVTPTQPGELSCGINVTLGARRPAWKEEYSKLAGPEAVERVIAVTLPGPETKKLIVMRQGRLEKMA